MREGHYFYRCIDNPISWGVVDFHLGAFWVHRLQENGAMLLKAYILFQERLRNLYSSGVFSLRLWTETKRKKHSDYIWYISPRNYTHVISCSNTKCLHFIVESYQQVLTQQSTNGGYQKRCLAHPRLDLSGVGLGALLCITGQQITERLCPIWICWWLSVS